MRRDDHPAVIDQAIGWHLRQAEMDEAGWRDFIVWLEQSPAHARAYDRIALVHASLDRRSFPPLPANDDGPARRRWPLFAGGAVAAALALALLVPLTRPSAPHSYLIQTAAGENRNVLLADGTRVELSGGTRLLLDRTDARSAELQAGNAVFTVRHDAAHPFTLRSGGIAVRDLGTVFGVARAGPRFEVQVSQGSVLFRRDSAAIVLVPGDALAVREDSGRIARSHIPVAAVGAWRAGSFSFEGDTLQSIFTTLDRTYGIRVVLDGDLGQRPFTGTIRVSGDAERDVPHLAALIGVDWRRNGNGWILTPRTGER